MSRYIQVTMHKKRNLTFSFPLPFVVLLIAGLATGLFRAVLWGLMREGVLSGEDIPGNLAFAAFYLFFVAVVWLGAHPGGEELKGHRD